MAIDKGDWHVTDAETWERACRHIGLYLAWAAGRGLASDEHDAKAAAAAPTAYFIKQCDTKLWDEDFNADGLKFTKFAYSDYCNEVSAFARRSKLGDYEIPDTKQTVKHFTAWLDARLDKWRTKSSTKAKTAKTTKPAKPKKPARSPDQVGARSKRTKR